MAAARPPRGRRSASSARPDAQRPDLVGSETPRLWTPEARRLTRATSRGYEIADFADKVLGEPLLPWQRWLAIHAFELDRTGGYRFRTIVVLVGRQNGKALDCRTPILTANRGWITMADARVGDLVYRPTGQPTRVTGVSNVMTGHPCYRVTTTDGRTLVADADHLWTVTDKRKHRSIGPRGNVRRYFDTVTLTTKEIAEAGLSRYTTGERTTSTGGKSYQTNEYRFTLPEQKPIESPDVPLPIDPYLLGAWLGDGDSMRAYLTVGEQDREHLLAQISAAGMTVGRQKQDPRTGAWSIGFYLPGARSDGVQPRLRALGVLGDKHVPDQYLTAGTRQREALLQGMLDTDGSIDGTRGQVEFCSTSRQLADAALYLARSLGWRATLLTHRATIAGRDCGPKYRVCFTPVRTDAHTPFRLPRKLVRIRPSDGGKGRATVAIKSIEPVDSVPVRCIKVAAEDGLYLAGRDLVATHNTHLARTFALWKLYLDGARLVLSVAQSLDIAREAWRAGCDTVGDIPDLRAELDRVSRVNGDEHLALDGGRRWKISAANRRAGRGLSVDFLLMDELREQRTWDAWSALSKTTMARGDGMTFGISNAGDDESVVLNHLREAALTGNDPTIGLFEWSAEDGCELDDPAAWAQANPGLGHTISEQAIRSALSTDPAPVFRTEVLCQRVDSLADSVVSATAWEACLDPAMTLDGLRDRTAVFVDLAPDLAHATLTVAALGPDGRVRLEAVASWLDTESMRADLPGWMERIHPQARGWFRSSPTAALEADLTRLGFESLGTAEATAACQGLAEQVHARRLLHGGDPLLTAQIGGAKRLPVADGWRFARRGAGHVDAAYAAAGAVHLARTMPEPVRPGVRWLAG